MAQQRDNRRAVRRSFGAIERFKLVFAARLDLVMDRRRAAGKETCNPATLKAFLFVIADRAGGESGVCYEPQDVLAIESGVQATTQTKLLKIIEDLGIAKVDRRHRTHGHTKWKSTHRIKPDWSVLAHLSAPETSLQIGDVPSDDKHPSKSGMSDAENIPPNWGCSSGQPEDDHPQTGGMNTPPNRGITTKNNCEEQETSNTSDTPRSERNGERVASGDAGGVSSVDSSSQDSGGGETGKSGGFLSEAPIRGELESELRLNQVGDGHLTALVDKLLEQYPENPLGRLRDVVDLAIVDEATSIPRYIHNAIEKNYHVSATQRQKIRALRYRRDQSRREIEARHEATAKLKCQAETAQHKEQKRLEEVALVASLSDEEFARLKAAVIEEFPHTEEILGSLDQSSLGELTRRLIIDAHKREQQAAAQTEAVTA